MFLENLHNLSSQISVLFVDDDDIAIELVSEMIGEHFCCFDVATNGQEGLELYKNHFQATNSHYDIVITDVVMPIMNGLEMCQEILTINPNQIVIAVSGENDRELLEKILELGIKNFIRKPINFSAMYQKLNLAIELIINERKEKEKLLEIEELNNELDALVDSFDKYVIASRTDLKGVITYASKAYQTISGYKIEELVGNPHNIVRHPDMPKEAFSEMWETIKSERIWHGEVKNLRKDGTFYWVDATVGPYYDKNKKHIGYSAIRHDITAKKEVEELNAQVNDLLNNTGQGFLSFDKNFIIGKSYSKECFVIFNEDIYLKNVSELLFRDSLENKEVFEFGIETILLEEDPISKEFLFSLLPDEIVLNNKILSLNFKPIQNEKFMLIVDDITQKRDLEAKIKYEQNIQKMIVAIVSNKNEFRELKIDFQSFLFEVENQIVDDCNIDHYINSLLKELHTFKGLFAQKELIHTPDAIHELESSLNRARKDQHITYKKIRELFLEASLGDVLQKDLRILEKILGVKCDYENSSIEVKTVIIDTIQKKLLHLKNGNRSQIEKIIDSLLIDIYDLKKSSLKELLSGYPSLCLKIADEVDKSIKPFVIKGDDSIFVNEEIKPFIRSLVHVFRNSIDHGIEDSETRLEKGKNKSGKIECSFEKADNLLSIKISDDGGGIDLDKVINKALLKGEFLKQEIEELSEQEQLQLIFHDNLSTKEEISKLSGRGIGLGSVKAELKKIGGEVTLVNKAGEGLTFIFSIPLVLTMQDKILEEYILLLIKDKMKSFIQNDMKIEILKSEEDIVYKNDLKLFENTSAIEIRGEVNILSVFSFEKTIIDHLSKSFVPQGFSQDEMNTMIQEIPFEVANIVLGLILKEIPNHNDIEITEPFFIKPQNIEKPTPLSKFFAVKIKTKGGDIICALIDRRNTRRITC